MNKLHLVIEREFTTRLRKKSFWVMTFVMPLLMLFIGFVPVLVSSVNEVDQQQVAILDHTGRYASLFEGNDSDSYRFVRVDRPLDSLRSEASQESITAILEIRGDLLKDPKLSASSLSSSYHKGWRLISMRFSPDTSPRKRSAHTTSPSSKKRYRRAKSSSVSPPISGANLVMSIRRPVL